MSGVDTGVPAERPAGSRPEQDGARQGTHGRSAGWGRAGGSGLLATIKGQGTVLDTFGHIVL